jgi:hypothetical protein
MNRRVVKVVAVYVAATAFVLSLWIRALDELEDPEIDFRCRPGETYTIKECP